MNSKKSKKKFLNPILIIILIIILCAVCAFLLYKNELFIVKKNESNPNNNTKNMKYKMIKFLNYSENENNKNGTSITETEKYYILEYLEEYNRRNILYDKNGNNVTKKVFGSENIAAIDGISYSNNKNYDFYIISTTDKKYGLYDKNLNQIVKIDNYIIEKTNNKNYFIVGDSIDNPTVTEWLENAGVYDKNGKLVIPREYERLYSGGMYNGNAYYDTDRTLFYARKNGKYGIIDQNNNIIIPFEYDRANTKLTLGLGEVFSYNNKNYFILYKNGKYGMVNENNEIIINFEKGNLFYNKYANVVIEQVYNNSNIAKLNIYDLNGTFKKEIVLNDDLKASFNAYYYKVGMTNFILTDNNSIYILNKNLEYDKYIKPAKIGYGIDTDLYLAGDNIYLKENNQKYKIHNTNDNSLFSEEEFYLINSQYITDIKGFTLCKNETDDSNYYDCGIIGFDGKNILNFDYKTMLYSQLVNENEYIEFEYDYTNEKYKIKKNSVNGKCIIDDNNYFIRDNIIKVNSSIYNLKCNKIADNVTNYYILNNNLVMTEKFEDNTHNTYKIYNINNGKIAKIDNKDNAIITNHINTNLLNNSTNLIVTDKGIYKIVKY